MNYTDTMTLCPGGTTEKPCRFREACLRYRFDPKQAEPEVAFRTWDFSPTIKMVTVMNMTYENCDWHIPIGLRDPATLKPHPDVVAQPLEAA